MKKIYVSDVTLSAYSEAKTSLSFREKLNIAQWLDISGVDAIELPALMNAKEDAIICRTIAGAMKNASVAIACGEDPAAAWDCVKNTLNPTLQIAMPTSTVQMEYTYHLKAPKMLEKIAALCKEASALCQNVELIAEDATRADAGFIAACAKAAAANGASAITVCDDSGSFFPEDYAPLIAEIKAAAKIKVYIRPSNALSMAAASAVAAIAGGADGIKTTAKGGLRADTLADIFRAKKDALQANCGLDSTSIHQIIKNILAGKEQEAEEAELQETESAAILDESCTLAEISAAAKALGYELSEEDDGKIYEEFKRVIAKKETIGARELEAIIASSAMQVPSTFHLVNYVVNSGNIITATANLTLEKDGEQLHGVSTGDGPIDAAFHAIEQIVGHHYELDDFQVHAVTKGREAVGSALIRLRADGKLYSGNGVSTDIIGACIRAYVNALNKIVYEK
jgi:2-isopropylmalate synthase